MENIDVNNKENEVKTPQELIDTTVTKVERILNDKFPEYIPFGDGTFTIERGSTNVMVIVRPFT